MGMEIAAIGLQMQLSAKVLNFFAKKFRYCPFSDSICAT